MEIDSKPVLETELDGDLDGDLVGREEPELSSEIDDAAERIRNHMTKTVENIIAIGRDLILVKERLGHGEFGKWIAAEFRMTDRSARNFMRVAERFEDKSEIISDFEPTVLYALAAPSTPDEVVEKALQQAQIGETISR